MGNPLIDIDLTTDAARAIWEQGLARVPRLLALLHKEHLGPSVTQKAGQSKYLILSALESGFSIASGQDRSLWNPCCIVMSPGRLWDGDCQ